MSIFSKLFGSNWELMSSDEVQKFGIETILPYVRKEGVEVSRAGFTDPQIVGTRWEKPAYIFVRTALYPDKGSISEQEFMRLLALATKNNATAFFASVGLCCRNYPDRSEIKDEKKWSLPIKNAGFAVAYEGLLVMTTSDKAKGVR